MKKILMLLALAATVALAVIPPPLPTKVTLAWDAPAGQVDGYYIYSTNVLTAPLPWPPLTNVPGTMTNVSILMIPGQAFFYVTASNFWGESGPSNVANTPPVVGSSTNTTIRKGS